MPLPSRPATAAAWRASRCVSRASPGSSESSFSAAAERSGAAGDRHAEQTACVFVVQAPHDEFGQPSKRLLVSGVAHREHEGDRLGHEPPRDECERQRGRLIEPLSIVDDANDRLLLGNLGQQPEHR
jgi:hypothetical protein